MARHTSLDPSLPATDARSSGQADLPAWRTEYPFASHYLTIDGHRLHYVDEGNGPPLLMVHGNPTWSFYYRKLVQRFRGSMRTLVPDHLGCGLSDKPAAYPYTLAQRTQNLQSFITQLDLRDITLVVHDWGGAIGLGAACALPERFARLILLNTGAFPPPFIPLRIGVCRIPGLGAVALQGFNLFARAATYMALQHPERMSDVAKAGMLAPYDSWNHRRAIYQFVRDIPTSPRHPTWNVLRDLEHHLAGLRHLPTCLIWGMRDWCFRPSCLTQLRGHFPAAVVHELPDVGHWVLEDAPDQAAEHIDQFLQAFPLQTPA